MKYWRQGSRNHTTLAKLQFSAFNAYVNTIICNILVVRQCVGLWLIHDVRKGVCSDNLPLFWRYVLLNIWKEGPWYDIYEHAIR